MNAGCVPVCARSQEPPGVCVIPWHNRPCPSGMWVALEPVTMMAWRNTKARLTHQLALLSTAFFCLMCGGHAATDQGGTGGSVTANGGNAGVGGAARGGTAGSSGGNGTTAGVAGMTLDAGQETTTQANGAAPIACTIDSECSYPPSSGCNSGFMLVYFTNPRCENKLCTYDVNYTTCSLTTTPGGFPAYGGNGGMAGQIGSDGSGAVSGAAGDEHGGEPSGP